MTGQLQEDRRSALEKMGISVESSGIKVDKERFFLVNLNADPSLNELLVYYIHGDCLVGKGDPNVVPGKYCLLIGQHRIIILISNWLLQTFSSLDWAFRVNIAE